MVTNNMIDFKNNKYSRLILWLLSILVFLILFSPTVLQYVKLIPLIALSMLSILTISKKMSVPIHPKVAIWVLVYITFNFLFLIKGTYNNLDIFVQLAPTNIWWPLVYTFALIIPSSKIEKFELSNIFIISTLFIEVYILYIYFNFVGVLPDSFLLNLPLGQSINYNFGYINFFIPSITSLFFLIPYIISLLLIGKDTKKSKLYFLLLVIVGAIISIVTGRRTLIALLAISPFISIFWSKITRDNKIQAKFMKVIIIVSVMVLISIIFLSLTEVGLRIQNLDTELIQSGLYIRINQFSSLIEGWKKSPILGSGLGVNADVVRSSTVPGAYELSYVARLFQTGIVGIVIYFLLILWIIRRLVYIARQDRSKIEYIIPLLTGLSVMMIAEATNPYLSSFDGLWVFFYALALINNHYLNRKKKGVVYE